MDAITVPLGPCDVHFRGTQVNVTGHMLAALERMRASLITVAQAGGVISYSQLVQATGGSYNQRNFGDALDILSIDCFNRDEPSLAALVVHKGGDHEVGIGFIGDPVAERTLCYEHWAS